MISWEITKRVGPWLALIVSMALTGYMLWGAGFDSGSQSVQAKWDAEKETHRRAMDVLQDKYANLEAQNRIQNQRNSDELAEKEKSHALTLARLNVEYAGRMQLSEQRANRYQRQAQSGAIEQANLARHAAELDRAVEEGRRLVAELAATLRQRDDQLRAVSQQLINDRKLLNLDEPK